MLKSDICIYTRTYRGDADFLKFLYKSIEKFCSDWGDVVLVVEADDYSIIKNSVPSWVKVVSEDSFCPGVIQHKYSKLTADLHTDKKYIFHIDSDSIFNKSIDIQDLVHDGKPYLEYASYEHLLFYQNNPNTVDDFKNYCKLHVAPRDLSYKTKEEFAFWLETGFESWFSEYHKNWKEQYGIDVWRQGTSFAIGLPVDHEFSRRPEKLYPRDLYAAARMRIESLHNMSLKEFISTRIGRQSLGVDRKSYFSDLNFLGAYLYNFMHEKIEWVDIQEKGYEYRRSFVKQYISYDSLSNGMVKKEVADEILSIIG